MDSWNQNYYKRPRFASEYGFQSLPSLHTIKTATNVTEDLDIHSDFMDKRQHHLGGYFEMQLLIKKQLELTKNTGEKFLNTFSYYSQVNLSNFLII